MQNDKIIINLLSHNGAAGVFGGLLGSFLPRTAAFLRLFDLLLQPLVLFLFLFESLAESLNLFLGLFLFGLLEPLNLLLLLLGGGPT